METKATKIYTENEAREIASKFSSRIEFKKGDNGAYRAVLTKFPHVLDEIFGERRNLVLTK